MYGAGLIVLDIIHVPNHGLKLYQLGGTCGNVLSMLSYLGWSSYPIGRIGDDIAGSIITHDLERHKISKKYVRQDLHETPTILEKLDMERGKHTFQLKCPHCRRHFSSYRSVTISQAISVGFEEAAPNVFFFDRSTPGNNTLANLAKRTGAIIVFEPHKISDDETFRKSLALADIVKYASSTLGSSLNDKGLSYVITADLLPKLEIETLSKDGVRYKLFGEANWKEIPPADFLNIVDSAGAGDWLTSSFLYYLFSKPSHLFERNQVEWALAQGQKIAGYNCQYIGARGSMDILSPSLMLSEAFSLMNSSVQNFPQQPMFEESEHSCPVCLRPVAM